MPKAARRNDAIVMVTASKVVGRLGKRLHAYAVFSFDSKDVGLLCSVGMTLTELRCIVYSYLSNFFFR